MELLPTITIYALGALPAEPVDALAAQLPASWQIERELTAAPIALGGPHGAGAVLALDLGTFVAPSGEPRDLGQTARTASERVTQLSAALLAALPAFARCYQAASELATTHAGQGTTWPVALTLALLLPGPQSAEQQALLPPGLTPGDLRAALPALAATPDFPRLPPPGLATVWPSAATMLDAQPARFVYEPRRGWSRA
jgi:hypothetical protein